LLQQSSFPSQLLLVCGMCLAYDAWGGSRAGVQRVRFSGQTKRED